MIIPGEIFHFLKLLSISFNCFVFMLRKSKKLNDHIHYSNNHNTQRASMFFSTSTCLIFQFMEYLNIAYLLMKLF